jgi:hypothetical protein
MFANATPERPALYFTVLGEPAIKMLRYQQQYSFFDVAKMDGAIRFINLSQVVLDQDLGAVLDVIKGPAPRSEARFARSEAEGAGGALWTHLGNPRDGIALHERSHPD